MGVPHISPKPLYALRLPESSALYSRVPTFTNADKPKSVSFTCMAVVEHCSARGGEKEYQKVRRVGVPFPAPPLRWRTHLGVVVVGFAGMRTQQNVVNFQVPVDDPTRVQVVQAVADFLDQLNQSMDRIPAVYDASGRLLPQAATLDPESESMRQTDVSLHHER